MGTTVAVRMKSLIRLLLPYVRTVRAVLKCTVCNTVQSQLVYLRASYSKLSRVDFVQNHKNLVVKIRRLPVRYVPYSYTDIITTCFPSRASHYSTERYTVRYRYRCVTGTATCAFRYYGILYGRSATCTTVRAYSTYDVSTFT